MGKLNLSNISTGLNKVKSIAESLSNVAHFENVPTDCIKPATNNPYSTNDTDNDLQELAMSIQANGLINPLAVNKVSDTEYQLISGERRFSAITKHLNWKSIPCMTYDNISLNAAQLKLHIANLDVREYTTAQKLQFYSDTEQLLHSMKESGEYTGPIQQGIAELLGVSTRQVRKYKNIADNLSPEEQRAVIEGSMSVDNAYQLSQTKKINDVPDAVQYAEWIHMNPESKSGSTSENCADIQTDDESKSGSTSENYTDIQTDDESKSGSTSENYADIQTDDESKSGSTSAFDNSFWDDKVKFAIKYHYNTKSLFIYYTFEVPTTQEAIKEKLKPSNGYEGGTVIFPDGIRGDCTCRSSQMDIEYNRKHVILTYSQVDSYIRDMIRAGEWLSTMDTHDIIKKRLNEIKVKSGSTSAFKKE